LEEWAHRTGVSSRTLTRAFEASTGVGFRTWAATARAHRAVALLAEGQRVEDVAALVGFRSASAFSAAFRRVTGVTPGEFRQPPALARPGVERTGAPHRPDRRVRSATEGVPSARLPTPLRRSTLVRQT